MLVENALLRQFVLFRVTTVPSFQNSFPTRKEEIFGKKERILEGLLVDLFREFLCIFVFVWFNFRLLVLPHNILAYDANVINLYALDLNNNMNNCKQIVSHKVWDSQRDTVQIKRCHLWWLHMHLWIGCNLNIFKKICIIEKLILEHFKIRNF